MTDYHHPGWIYIAPSELVRADRVISLHVSDGDHHNRAGETNASGVLWAYVEGRPEPVRIGGFIGITAAKLLEAMSEAIDGAVSADHIFYISLGERRASQTHVVVDTVFPRSS